MTKRRSLGGLECTLCYQVREFGVAGEDFEEGAVVVFGGQSVCGGHFRIARDVYVSGEGVRAKRIIEAAEQGRDGE